MRKKADREEKRFELEIKKVVNEQLHWIYECRLRAKQREEDSSEEEDPN